MGETVRAAVLVAWLTFAAVIYALHTSVKKDWQKKNGKGEKKQ